MPAPRDYQWVDEVLGEAACVTAVAGATPQEVDAVFRSESVTAPVLVQEVSGGVIAVELNGFQGSLDAVLEGLSTHGRAASIFWNVEDDNAFSCARHGRVHSTADMYDAEYPDDVDLPSDLMPLFISAADDDGVSLWAVGLAMVEAFTGVVVPEEAVRSARSARPLLPGDRDGDGCGSKPVSASLPFDAVADHVRGGRLPVLRTDYADDDAWMGLLTRLRAERLGTKAAPVEDNALAGMSGFALRDEVGGRISGHILLADAQAMREQSARREVTVLWLDLSIDWNAALHAGDELLGQFRCPVGRVEDVWSALNLGYLDIEDFSELQDDDGVVRRVP